MILIQNLVFFFFFNCQQTNTNAKKIATIFPQISASSLQMRSVRSHLQAKYQMRNAATAKRTRSPTKTPIRVPVLRLDIFSLLLRKSIRSWWWPFRPWCGETRDGKRSENTHSCNSLNACFTLNQGSLTLFQAKDVSGGYVRLP